MTNARKVSLILLVLAAICAGVFTAFGFDWISTDHPYGWLGAFGLFVALSFVPE